MMGKTSKHGPSSKLTAAKAIGFGEADLRESAKLERSSNALLMALARYAYQHKNRSPMTEYVREHLKKNRVIIG